MNRKIFLPTIIVLVVIQLFLYQSRIFPFFDMVLIATWSTYYFFDMRYAIAVILLLGIPFELFTFSYMGLFGFCFSAILFLLYLAHDALPVIRFTEDTSFYIIGLCCNTILYKFISFIIVKKFFLVLLIVSVIINVLIFISLNNIFRRPKNSGYVT